MGILSFTNEGHFLMYQVCLFSPYLLLTGHLSSNTSAEQFYYHVYFMSV